RCAVTPGAADQQALDAPQQSPDPGPVSRVEPAEQAMQVMATACQVQGSAPRTRVLQRTENRVRALIVAQGSPPRGVPRGDGLRIVDGRWAVPPGIRTSTQHPVVVGWF